MKKKTLKITGILIIILLIVSIFTGCNNSSSFNSSIDLTDDWKAIEIQENIDKHHYPQEQAYLNPVTGEVIQEIDNQIVNYCKVPVGSKYIGFSVWAGYIFQYGTTVYSVFQPHSENNIIVVNKDVIDVIDCNTYLTSDAFSNPIFLMKDGSLKGYITWEDDLVDYP